MKEEIKISEIGNCIKIVTQESDKPIEDNEALANAIEEFFNVKCTKQDIDEYEKLTRMPEEDYSLESRRHGFFINSGKGIYW